MTKKLNIAYITETSPNNKHAWSGTAHYVFEALKKQGHHVIALGPKQPKTVGFFCKVINQFTLKLLNKRFDYRHSIIYSKAFGKLFSKELKNINYDIVVVCGGSEYCAYLQTTKPMYLIVDRTIQGALGYHKILSNLLAFSERQSIFTDKKAMLQCNKVFFASHWAANHAKHFYNLPITKSFVLPFGANLDTVPSSQFVFENKITTTGCNLLLIGTHWQNKGVDIAINTLNLLIKKGINAHLTIVGCTPPYELKNENISNIPFINKNNETGLLQMQKLFLENDFFILPTRFEAYGIVFCEASAYGLISLATDTGGIPTVVKEGVNGFLIPETDNGELYATKIDYLINHQEELKQLNVSARHYYETTLNWEKWAEVFMKEVY